MAEKLAGYLRRLKDPVGEFVDYARIVHGSRSSDAVFKEELESLRNRFRRICATLLDMEHIVVTSEADKLWLQELNDLKCKAEDVLEEFEFESTRDQLFQHDFASDQPRVAASKKRKLLFPVFEDSRSRLLSKIEKIRKLHEDIAFDRDALRLDPQEVVTLPGVNVSKLDETTSRPKGSLYGREQDVEKIIDLLLSENGMPYQVIAIVGMVGVGKTCLMQHVFHEDVVAAAFHVRGWASVQREHDKAVVARRIAGGFGIECSSSELEQLSNSISNYLKGKRFLLVLDDLELNNDFDWRATMSYLRSAARGSKVVVTTQRLNVAKMIASETEIHRLNCLTNSNFTWSICVEAAFPESITIDDTELQQMIAHKCKGSPLVAEMAGLEIRSNLSVWNRAQIRRTVEHVLEPPQWERVMDRVLRYVKVNYERLPSSMKSCFGYCSLFPREFEYRKSDLVQLWTAQGFVAVDRDSVVDQQEYSRCIEAFDDLQKAFFFHDCPRNGRTAELYVMHEIYYELARSVSGKECCRKEKNLLLLHFVDEKTRHLSLTPLQSSSVEKITVKACPEHERSISSSNLRTFLFVSQDQHPFGLQLQPDEYKCLSSLRVLDLSNTDIAELSNSVGKLIHLRYLGLENTQIKCLPVTLCCLFKLETLNLRRCSCLAPEEPTEIKRSRPKLKILLH